MRKAIYLDIMLHLEPIQQQLNLLAKLGVPGVNMPTAPLNIDELIAEVSQAIKTAAQKRPASPAKITYEVKRARPAKLPNDGAAAISLMLYMEGEQDAPVNFAALATSEAHKFLEETLAQPSARKVKVKVGEIVENTNAVDELADEEDAAGSSKTDR